MSSVERVMLNAKLQTLGKFCFEIANMLDYYNAAYGEELPDDEKWVLNQKLEQLQGFLSMTSQYLNREQIEDEEFNSFMSDIKNKYHSELSKVDENEIST